MDLLKYIYLYKIRINDGYYDNTEKLFLIKSK